LTQSITGAMMQSNFTEAVLSMAFVALTIIAVMCLAVVFVDQLMP
jgi:hypothetical protein